MSVLERPGAVWSRFLETALGSCLDSFPDTSWEGVWEAVWEAVWEQLPRHLPRLLLGSSLGRCLGSSLQTASQTGSWNQSGKQSGLLPRLVPWNQSGHHPRPRPDASLWWHHFRVMQVLVGLTHVGVMRSATWLLPNAPLLLDTLVAHQVCSVEALVRSCHAKASHFQFDRKFITLTLQHVTTQL